MTPIEIVLDQEVSHVTLEDATGSLGVRPGHAPLATALVPGIVIARDGSGHETYTAVNGGVALIDGENVRVASRRAVVSRDFEHLQDTVVADFEKDTLGDRSHHAAFEKMRMQFMRGILDFDRADVQ